MSVTDDRLLVFAFCFCTGVSSTFLSCSNPGALGVDDSEKGIFASLKNITQLPLSPPRNDDRLGDSAAGTAESPATEEGEGKKTPIADTIE